MQCLLIEPNDIVRVGIKSVLSEHGLDVRAESSYASLSTDSSSVFLVGFSKENASNAVRAIQKVQRPENCKKIICMSEDACVEEWETLSRIGVLGYCTRNISIELLLLGIHSVEQGATFLCPLVRQRSLNYKFRTDEELLSKREREVLKILATGRSNQQIADNLGISIETVKAHVKSVLSKLSVSDRTQAAIKAIKCGLIAAD